MHFPSRAGIPATSPFGNLLAGDADARRYSLVLASTIPHGMPRCQEPSGESGRKRASNRCMSPGSGAEKHMRSPVRGWLKLTDAACSA